MKSKSQFKNAIVSILIVIALFIGCDSGRSADGIFVSSLDFHQRHQPSGINGGVFYQGPTPFSPFFSADHATLLIYKEAHSHNHREAHSSVLHLIKNVTTGLYGDFQLILEPGTYVIAPPVGGEIFGSTFTPVTVIVQRNQMAFVTIIIPIDDTGF